MSTNRIILVIKASDIDISSLPEDKRDIKSRAFKDAVYSHLLKNYGISGENIMVHIQNEIITIEWNPLEKDESFDAEYQRSMLLLTDGKLEEARFIMEDLAFRSPDDPNVLYNLGWSGSGRFGFFFGSNSSRGFSSLRCHIPPPFSS